jgi:hypothetical protein
MRQLLVHVLRRQTSRAGIVEYTFVKKESHSQKGRAATGAALRGKHMHYCTFAQSRCSSRLNLAGLRKRPQNGVPKVLAATPLSYPLRMSVRSYLGGGSQTPSMTTIT